MLKLIICQIICLGISISAIAQNTFDIEKYPPQWNGESLTNSISFLFPFKDCNSLREAAIYFEKQENSEYITMRYRVFPNYSIEQLNMKDTPEMLIKLGDGSILTGKKDRIVDGIVNASVVIDVYYYLGSELQQKIIKYGVEKVRIAYVYDYLGLNKNQIFDAYTKDSEMKGISVEILLKQILNADLAKAKKEAAKKSLNYGF